MKHLALCQNMVNTQQMVCVIPMTIVDVQIMFLSLLALSNTDLFINRKKNNKGIKYEEGWAGVGGVVSLLS